MGVGAIAAGFQAGREPRWIVFILGWMIASGYLIWFGRRLKVVSIDEEFIYVSQGRKEIKIPLAHIEGVTENFWANPKLIKLKLNRPSELGMQIVFVPTRLSFAALRTHPVVEEIKRVVQLRRSTF